MVTRATFPTANRDVSGAPATTLPCPPTGSYNLAASKCVVVTLQWEDSSSTGASVTDTAGNTYTPGTVQQVVANPCWIQQFYCLSSTANATNVFTGNYASGSTFRAIQVSVYNLTNTAALVAQATGASGTSANPATAAFAAGDFAVAGCGDYSGLTTTAGTGWTEQFDLTGYHIDDRVDSPGGTYIADFTLSGSAPWGIVAMSFSDQAGGSPPVLNAIAPSAQRNRRHTGRF